MRRSTSKPVAVKLGLLTLWLLFLLVPLIYSRSAHDNFRLPKLLLSDCLALASLALLSLRLQSVERVDLKAFFRQPVVLAVLPVLAVATSGLLTSEHPLHVRQALVSLWIGGACLIGWSLALTEREHRQLLRGLILPAVALSVFGILQFHRLFNPLQFDSGVSQRIGLTSLAGGAFDLSAYLALPCLIAQVGWYTAPPGRWRWAWGAAALLCVYTTVATLTLTSILALGAATFVLWLVLLPRRRFAAIVAVMALAGAGIGLGLEPLRERLENKLEDMSFGKVSGRINRLLSGRLDGWRAAVWMLQENPWTGVGHGAYRAEFGSTKLALSDQGVRFYQAQTQPYFVNAHSDPLEALAEWGIPGGLALLWGILLLARTLRRLIAAGRRSDAALMSAGLVALSILALTNFPFRLALVAYPALLFLSWIFVAQRSAAQRVAPP